MPGYTAIEVLDKIIPRTLQLAERSGTRTHPIRRKIGRAEELSAGLSTAIMPGFEALVFKASRGIEDIYELTYIPKDGSRFPAVVSVAALRNEHGRIIGYLLIGTGNTARKQAEEAQKKLDQRFRDQHFYTRSLIESSIGALMTSDPQAYSPM